jgi:hypothetical protein
MGCVFGRSFCLFMTGVLLSGCLTTAEAVKKYPVGTTVRDAVVLGSKQIPLPPGKWEVYASNEGQSSFSSPLNQLVLVNTENKRLPRAVALSTNVEGGARGYGWNTMKACSRNDMHHRLTEDDTPGGRQACWFINHTRMTRTNKTPRVLRAALDRVIAKGRPLPLTSVYVGMRVADSLDYLTIRYYFNPESDGFAPPRVTTWRSNDWHRDRVHEDPKKVDYVESVKRWGEVWYSKVKAGFAGKLAATAGRPKTK